MKAFVPLAFVFLLGAIVLCSGQTFPRFDRKVYPMQQLMRFARKVFSKKNDPSSDVVEILDAALKNNMHSLLYLKVRLADNRVCTFSWLDQYETKGKPQEYVYHCQPPRARVHRFLY